MKQILFLSMFLPFISAVANAQKTDDVVGTWMNEAKNGKIEIYRSGDTYFGKLIWATNLVDANGVSRKDVNNPDDHLKSRPLLNLVFLTGFVFDDGSWQNGKVYDPKSGKTYSSTMKIVKNQLEIRGFIGISLFGKTTVWQRV
jgi:uncharacterized protein (DUF2147 family)